MGAMRKKRRARRPVRIFFESALCNAVPSQPRSRPDESGAIRIRWVSKWIQWCNLKQ